MEQTKVLVYFNQKKGVFSVEALEGENKGRVIAHVQKITLTECTFSKNKGKTAGIIGMWQERFRDIDPSRAVGHYFDAEEDADGFSPVYYGELFKYDSRSERYIVEDDGDFMAFSHETSQELQNDPNFEQATLDNPALVCMDIWEDEDPKAEDVRGIAYYWRKKSKKLS